MSTCSRDWTPVWKHNWQNCPKSLSLFFVFLVKEAQPKTPLFPHCVSSHLVEKVVNVNVCGRFSLQVTCMLGLLYLTSVTGLLAASAALHQLDLLNAGPVNPALFHPHASASSLHPRCWVLTNTTQKPEHTLDLHQRHQRHHRSPTSAPALHPNSALSLWSSLLAALVHSDARPSGLHVCGAQNVTSFGWFSSPVLLPHSPFLSHAHPSPLAAFHRHSCCPEAAVPYGKVQVLLVPT